MPISTALLKVVEPIACTTAMAQGAGLQVALDSRVGESSPGAYWAARPTGHGVELIAAGRDRDALEAARRHVTALTTDSSGDPLCTEWTDPVMGGDLEIIPPAVSDYLLGHAPGPDPLLRDLFLETLEVTAGAAPMQVSHDEGALLTLLTQLVGAQYAVEVGTFTGYSSICIARGLSPGGRLITCDVSNHWMEIASGYWARAGLSEMIDARVGPAIDTLKNLPAEPTIDLAFIDADKEGYPSYYEELVPRLQPGGLIILDNVFLGGRVFDPAYQEPHHAAMRDLNDRVAADGRVEALMIPVRDGLTLARRKA